MLTYKTLLEPYSNHMCLYPHSCHSGELVPKASYVLSPVPFRKILEGNPSYSNINNLTSGCWEPTNDTKRINAETQNLKIQGRATEISRICGPGWPGMIWNAASKTEKKLSMINSWCGHSDIFMSIIFYIYGQDSANVLAGQIFQ